jgi:hypothetical protein
MELPIGTVMSSLARAKAYLRGRLAPVDEPNGVAKEQGDRVAEPATTGAKKVTDGVP